MLWVDAYRPKALEKMDYHQDLSDKLMKMVHGGDFPHLLFYGPSGAGKKTRIMALLRELYGPSIEKLKIENKEFVVGASKRKVELTVLSSNYHVELTPSEAGRQDTFVIQDLLKEIADNQQITSSGARSFKVVVLNEVDKLSRQAQNSLRRTMEKYTATCRLILCCNSTCKVIAPLRSRCLSVRVAAPTHDQICDILRNICKKQGLELPPEFALRIAERSGRNLRKAILMLESSKVSSYPFVANQPVEVADWESFVESIADMVLQEQSPQRLLMVRGKFYELLTHCIPPDVIFRTLTLELLKKLDSKLKGDIAAMACTYEHRMKQGSKAIFHLEAFVARFMSSYKNYLLETFGGM